MVEKIKNAVMGACRRIGRPHVYSLVMLGLCYLTLRPLRERLGWVFCIALLILCYISSQTVRDNLTGIHRYVKTKLEWMLWMILFLYTVFAFFGIAYLEGFAAGVIVVILLGAAVWMAPVFVAVMNVLYGFLNSRNLQSEKLDWKWAAGAFGLLMLNYTLWIIAFNPCISSPDSEDLFYLAHVIGETGMSDWHPPFYVLVLRMLISICDSATFLIYVQCAFFSLVLIELLATFWKRGISKRLVVFAYVTIGFSFSSVLQMVSLWKDIPYLVSLLWLTSVLIRLFWREDNKVSVLWSVELICALVFTALFRHNGVLPVLGVIVCLLAYFFRRKLYVGVLPVVVAVAAGFLIKGPIYDSYNVVSAPSLKFLALANDLMGTYYAGCNTSEEVMEIVMEISGGDPDNWGFSSYYTKTNDNARLEYSIPEFLGIYIKTFFEHPKALAGEFLRRNSVIWSVVRPSREPPGCVNYMEEWHSMDYEYTYPLRKENSFTYMFTELCNRLTNIRFLYIFVWRTGIYLLLLLYLFYFVWRGRKKLLSRLMPFVPIMLNILAVAVGSGWPDYRYYWPTAILAVILLLYSKGELSNGSAVPDKSRHIRNK